jgi:transposase
MTQETISMTYHEIDRLHFVRQCLDKKMSQRHAAKTLNITEQHMKRLINRYKQFGPAGLSSQSRGKPSNRRYQDEIKQTAIDLIKRDFHDFGSTLAAEKLDEYHNIKISKETARQWMIEADIWRAHQKRIPKLHPSRERRFCVGELLQIDGSDHDWFEGRAPRCTLLVFIDDATSNILKLFFCNDETTLNYFTAFKDYVLRYGAPRSLYNDKHGVFKVNHPEAKSGNGVTQFGRVLVLQREKSLLLRN